MQGPYTNMQELQVATTDLFLRDRTPKFFIGVRRRDGIGAVHF